MTYKISDQVKKHSKHSAHHSGKPVSSNGPRKEVYKKKIITKPIVEKALDTKDLNPFYKMAIALHKTKELHNKKNIEKALEQLIKLKSEVWKSRKVENSPTKLVMSILSSIDITKSKWINKDINYDLENVEQKINQLFFKLGVTK